MPRIFSTYKSLSLAVALAAASGLPSAGAVESSAPKSPWAYNLTLYTWLPGIKGDYSAGPRNQSVDASFIDIAGQLRNFPLAFNGRGEAHYERLGVYLDGNYIHLDFRPRLNRGISQGLTTELSIMEYGATYRLFGPAASERIAGWDAQPRSNTLEVYAGGRTIWLDNKIEILGKGIAGAGRTLTSPLLGVRFTVDFTPQWFALVDANGGGFGVDQVNFTGSVLGAVGYRTTLFGVPTSLEAGYKALRVDVSKPIVKTNTTLNGAFVGLTGYW